MDRHLKQNLSKILRAVVILLLVFTGLPVFSSETSLYRSVVKASEKGQREETVKKGELFLRSYPYSKKRFHIQYTVAMNRVSIDQSIEDLIHLASKEKNHTRKTQAFTMACHLLIMDGNWKKTVELSSSGLRYARNVPVKVRFLLIRTRSLIRLGDYNEAEKDCRRITDLDHSYRTLGIVMLLRAYISRQKYGFSREYIYRLREAATGFSSAPSMPSILLLLGEFYQSTGDTNRAFSAFTDLEKRYPHSPEEDIAQKKLEELKKKHPSYIPYLPDEATLKSTDLLNIKPEMPLDRKGDSSITYALSIGPLPSRKAAIRISRVVKSFGSRSILQVHRGYIIILSRSSNKEDVHRARIRIAEEYGINGTIIRIAKKNNREYIYSE